MFVIIGVCVSVIPDGESRKIKHLRVFFITSFWSIFAYIWLYLILAVISPGIVEVCVRLYFIKKEKNLLFMIIYDQSFTSICLGMGGHCDAALLSGVCSLGLDC